MQSNGTTNTTERIKILFIVPGLDENNCLGYALKQAKSLDPTVFEVQIHFFDSRGSFTGILKNVLSIYKENRQFAPDLVHTHYGSISGFVSALATFPKIFFLTFHGSDLNPSLGVSPSRRYLSHVFSQIAALRASKIICVSLELSGRLWWKKSSVEVIPCGFDSDIFFPIEKNFARRELGFSPEKKIIVFNAGRKDQHVVKNLEFAESIFAAAKSKLKEFDFGFVVFDGTYDQNKINLILNAADCLMLFSHYEGSPMIVKEALACNLNVLAFDVGDLGAYKSEKVTTVSKNESEILEKLGQILKSDITADETQVVSNKQSVKRLEELYLSHYVCNRSLASAEF